MKLVDLLARELEDWPEGYLYIVQEGDGELYKSSHELTYGGICSWYGAGDYFSPELFARKSSDYKTAIINRAQWQQARDKLQEKPKVKANKDGWIRHRGGKCPVEDGVLVYVRFRDGEIQYGAPANQSSTKHEPCDADSAFWINEGTSCDIMAYRISATRTAGIGDGCTAACDAEVAKGITVMPAPEDGPLSWRDRIRSIDAARTAEEARHCAAMDALDKERQGLVERLSREGLMLAPVLVEGKSGKPSWTESPEWAQWLAEDKFGWCWYALKPYKMNVENWARAVDDRETQRFQFVHGCIRGPVIQLYSEPRP
jgi:hypothetical protein